MALIDDLLQIERELAAGPGDAYRRHLADEAVVIVPGQSLDREQTAAAIDASPGWDDFSLDDARLLELGGDGAVITYRFDGARGADFSYTALMSSAYRRTADGWRLVLHQQTPLPAGG